MLEPLLRLRVVCFEAVPLEQVQVWRPVLDPGAPHVDRAAPADLTPRPGSGTLAAWDRTRTTAAPRRPRAGSPAGTPRAVPDRYSIRGRSRGRCRRSTAARRSPQQDLPRCPRPADRTDPRQSVQIKRSSPRSQVSLTRYRVSTPSSDRDFLHFAGLHPVNGGAGLVYSQSAPEPSLG